MVQCWAGIQEDINQMIGLSARLVLLNDWGQQDKSRSKLQVGDLVGHLLVARLLLASKWKSEIIRTKEEWLQMVPCMCLMDKL